MVSRVQRRVAAKHALDAGAAAAIAGAIAAAISRAAGWTEWPAALAAVVAGGGVAVPWFIQRRHARTVSMAAAAVERARPELLNVVFTAVELSSHPDRARPWVRERVLSDASRALASVSAPAVVPLRSSAVICAMSLAIAVAAIFNLHVRAPRAGRSIVEQAVGRQAPGAGATIVALLEPPRHTRLPAQTLSDPERISAVQGTRLRLEIRGGLRQLRFSSRVVPARLGDRGSIAELSLVESGYLAVESDAGQRLIPVAVVPDRAPAIKVEKPGRDLLVATAGPSIGVVTSATDDFGLEQLGLRYTKVSGSGEQFEFEEGELPLAVDRHDAKSWRGRGELALARLGLEPGDSLVYRVVARDGRPGDAGLASSDTFFVEVAGPGQVALEGFEMPPDRERHALSQQMIVLKIQRLRERERTLTLAREPLQEQSADIAAEQRAVRANFVFLMGGHVEDEEEEAEHSNEIQEGRLENTSRQEISRAIGHMTLAEQRLVSVDTAGALREARLAVDALQRAFGRNRYILRTLPVRSRVDPSRRLTGKLDEAQDWNRAAPDRSRDDRTREIRELLAAAIAVADDLKRGIPVPTSSVASLPERALALGPADPEWQQISSRLAGARDALASGSPRDAEPRLADALVPLVRAARRAATPRGIDAGRPSALRGSWAEELRPR